MERITGCFSIIFILLIVFPVLTFASNSWVLVDQELDIKVYKKDVDQTDIDRVRAQMEITATIQQLASIIRDIENFPNWMYGCKESKIISGTDERRFTFYYLYGVPWPYNDRDAVLDITTKDGLKQGWFEIKLSSFDSEYIIDNNLIRMSKMEGVWYFEKISDTKSRVQLELFVNPAGNVPDFAVNIISPMVILETFKGLMRTINQTEYERKVDDKQRQEVERALEDAGIM